MRNLNSMILIWLEQCQAASFQKMSTTIIIENFRPSNDHSFARSLITQLTVFPRGCEPVEGGCGLFSSSLCLQLALFLAGHCHLEAPGPQSSCSLQPLTLGSSPTADRTPLITAYKAVCFLDVSENISARTVLRDSLLRASCGSRKPMGGVSYIVVLEPESVSAGRRLNNKDPGPVPPSL